MESTLYLSFLFISIGLIIIPGPNVLVIVSTSISHGKVRGLQTVAGTTLAMALQLLIAALGTAWFIRMLANGFSILKWLGVTWLLYLGLLHIKRSFMHKTGDVEISAARTFSRGFMVSLANPKTILFFSAFMPQFVTSAGDYLAQITLLSVTFLFLAALLDACYAILAARLQVLLEKRRIAYWQNPLSGLIYTVAGIWLAVTRRAG